MAATKRQEAKAATRAKILACARAAFDRLGYEGADVRTIAAAINMSTGAIFAHFKGKAELYREVFGHDPIAPEVGRELLAVLRAVMPSTLIGEGFEPPIPDDELLRECFFTWGKFRAARAAIALATDSAEARQDKAA